MPHQIHFARLSMNKKKAFCLRCQGPCQPWEPFDAEEYKIPHAIIDWCHDGKITAEHDSGAVCPYFAVGEPNTRLWCDAVDPRNRECGGKRFRIEAYDDDGNWLGLLFDTENEGEILHYLNDHYDMPLPAKPVDKRISFEDFQATRRRHTDADSKATGVREMNEMTWVYAGALYLYTFCDFTGTIGRTWVCPIGRCEHVSTDIRSLEAILYSYGISEGIIKLPEGVSNA